MHLVICLKIIFPPRYVFPPRYGRPFSDSVCNDTAVCLQTISCLTRWGTTLSTPDSVLIMTDFLMELGARGRWPGRVIEKTLKWCEPHDFKATVSYDGSFEATICSMKRQWNWCWTTLLPLNSGFPECQHWVSTESARFMFEIGMNSTLGNWSMSSSTPCRRCLA